MDGRDEGRTTKRMYPDAGLRTPVGEYESSLVETVKEVFGKRRTK